MSARRGPHEDIKKLPLRLDGACLIKRRNGGQCGKTTEVQYVHQNNWHWLTSDSHSPPCPDMRWLYSNEYCLCVLCVEKEREREIGKGVALKDPRWSVPSTGSCYTFYILVHLLYVYSMSINVQIMHQVQSEYEDFSRFNIYHVTYALYMSLTCVHEHKGSSRPGFHA